QNEVGITTRLRIKKAQLADIYTDNILSKNCKLEDTGLKYNLVYKVILEGKKLGFSFQKNSVYKSILEVLENVETRKLKEELCIKGLNQNTIKYRKAKILSDKRKKEWIIFENKKQFEYKRVYKKEHKYILLKHWLAKEKSGNFDTVLSKCRGREEKISLTSLASAYMKTREVLNKEEDISVKDVEINILSLEEALIQRVVKNEVIQEELINITSRIKDKKVVEIYIDSIPDDSVQAHVTVDIHDVSSSSNQNYANFQHNESLNVEFENYTLSANILLQPISPDNDPYTFKPTITFVD
ncbi:10534_t:CDS:2, partial [Cetraspora pellucida]